MQTELPYYESPEDALRAAMQHLGGAKVVGSKLWPDKSPDAARTRLLDALNPARTERLCMSESMFILREAAAVGLHGPFFWVAGELGYEARPVSRDDGIERCTAVIEQATKTMAAAMEQMRRLQGGR